MSSKNLSDDLITYETEDFKNSSQDKQLQKIQQMKFELQESIKEKDEKEDPDNILYTNIDRANRFLDILEQKIMEKNENITDDPKEEKKKKKKTMDSISRLFEVSAQLINAITTASQSIAGGYNDNLEYQYKLEKLELERDKFLLQHALGGGNKGKVTNNNLNIFTDREKLLDMITEEQQKKEEGE